MPDLDYSNEYNPENDKTLVVQFRTAAKHNPHSSAKEGRPVYDTVEYADITMPADRNRKLTVRADQEWKRFGNRVVTYAERFKEQYKRFKANEVQVVDGTPLKELPFLTEGQRASLRALDIYTAEQLSGLTGQSLKNIGVGGLNLQQQAKAYLDKASGTADTVAMAARIAELERERDELMRVNSAQTVVAETQKRPENIDKTHLDHDGDGVPGGVAPRNDTPVTRFESMSKEALKDWIEAKVGKKPQGNFSQQNLVRIAEEIESETAA